jgi:hypothetical protein
MNIQLQFSEIMGCANLFQRFLTLAVYCVSTRVHELSVLVLFPRSRDFIPGITFKDVLRFEERNKNVFFLIMRGIRDST